MRGFIEKLNDLNLFLVVKNGDLILKGKIGKLTAEDKIRFQSDPSIVDFIRTNKAELIEYLNSQAQKTKDINVSAVYQLSSMQESMLFHAFYDPGSFAYVEQIAITLHGDCSRSALEVALKSVVRRHTILRSCFALGSFESPVQCVHENIEVPCVNVDLSVESESSLVDRYSDLLDQERKKPFDLNQPPLFRFCLARIDAHQSRLIWTYHHLLLDGRSTVVLIEEILLAYEAVLSGEPVKGDIDRYEEYVNYLKRRNIDGEKRFWRRYLNEFKGPSTLPFRRRKYEAESISSARKLTLSMDEDSTRQLREFARVNRLTVNTIVQGTWAFLLSAYTNQKICSFGVTVSVRPVELPNADSRAGVFINTIPIKAEFQESELVVRALSKLQADHAESREYQDASLSEIKSWISHPGELYDSIIIFDHNSLFDSDVIRRSDSALQVAEVESTSYTNYPLTITSKMSSKLTVEFNYFESILHTIDMKKVVSDFQRTLEHILSDSNRECGDVQQLFSDDLNSERNQNAGAFFRSQHIRRSANWKLPTDCVRSIRNVGSQSSKTRAILPIVVADSALETFLPEMLCSIMIAIFKWSSVTNFNISISRKKNPNPSGGDQPSYTILPCSVYPEKNGDQHIEQIKSQLESAQRYSIEYDLLEVSETRCCVSIALIDSSSEESVFNEDLQALAGVNELVFTVHERKGRIEVGILYDSLLFHEMSIRGLQNLLVKLASELRSDRYKQISKFDGSEYLVRQSKRNDERYVQVSLLSTFTIDPLADYLRGLAALSNINLAIDSHSYSKLVYEIQAPDSSLYRSEVKSVVFIRWEDLAIGWQSDAEKILFNGLVVMEYIKNNMGNFREVAICICEPSDAARENELCVQNIERLDALLKSAIGNSRYVSLIEMSTILNLYELSAKKVSIVDYAFDIPYTEKGYAVLALGIWRQLYKKLHSVYKVIAVDCDNTLWEGVCAEAGPLGVSISPPFRFLHQMLKQLRKDGILLAICSKNIPDDVQRVFNENPGMLLQEDDFVVCEVNWESKAANLIKISRKLKLDLASFIFIDDDPVQCEEVRNRLPQVKVLRLPVEKERMKPLLQRTWLFDRDLNTAPIDRTEAYRTEFLRDQLIQESIDHEQFIKQMHLQVDIESIGESHYDRVVEMSQRINQFNVTGKRFGLEDIQKFFCSSNHHGFLVNARDKFGDYGFVGAVLYEQSDTVIMVHSYLLSCRALGRGLEFNMLNHLGEIALTLNKETIQMNFKPTDRNKPATLFIETINAMNGISAFDASKAKYKLTSKTNEQKRSPEEFNYTTGELIQSETLNECMNDPDHFISLVKPNLADIENDEHLTIDGMSLEGTLLGFWRKLLGRDNISLQDDFFKIGGHSLLATRLASMVKKNLAIDLELRTIFENRTIAELAESLRNHRGKKGSDIFAKESQVPIPLSFAQERIWFIDKLEGSIQYHVPIVLKISGKLEVTALKHAFENVVRRHEIFRTTYHEGEDGDVYQKVSMDMVCDFRYHEFEPSSTEVDTRHLINQVIATKFDLSSDSIMRVRLWSNADNTFMLAIVIHHIGFDGWSEKILVNEIVESYKAKVADRSPNLISLPIQYTDVALRQRESMRQDNVGKSLAYWENKLSGITPLRLPLDFTRPEVHSNTGHIVQRLIDGDTVGKLRELSKSVNCTMFTSLFTAFTVLLSRYTGSDDLCIGIPAANRSMPEYENLIGFFSNTLAIRTKIALDNTVKELLLQVHSSVIDALAHQEVPFEKVVNQTEKSRNLNRTPLFQVMFAMQHDPIEDYRTLIDDLEISKETFEHSTSIFDLTMQVEIIGETIRLTIEYCEALFLQHTIERMLNAFEGVLQAMIRDREMKISELSVISEADTLLLNKFNETSIRLEIDKTVVDLFEKQVKLSPDSVAIQCSAMKLTYEQLNSKANQLARYLCDNGLNRNDNVAVLVGRSSWAAVVMLGIFKAGGVYVPIDPDYPEMRIHFLLQHCAAKKIIVGKSFKVTSDSSGLLEIGNGDFLNDYDPSNLNLHLTNNEPSYIIYTSGSTGTPKGVVQTHLMLHNLIQWGLNRSGLSHKQKYLQFSSFCFDSSLHDILFATTSGGTACIISEDERKDVWLLRDYIVHNQITTVSMPYSGLKTLFDTSPPDEFAGHCINEIISTGEALYINGGLRDFLQLNPEIKIFNFYGPSETHVVTSSYYRFSDGPTVPVTASIGKPIDNTAIYILNPGGKQVPIGVVGEIYIGGYNLAMGYNANEDETKRRFVKNAASGDQSLYRTGDLGKWQIDGTLDYLGRIDNQVKVRGYRIEVDEIENVLQQCPIVLRGAITVQTDKFGDLRIIGYVMLRDGGRIDEVESFLKIRLPDYMIPSVVIALDEFPVTSNGKVDKARLLPPPFDRTDEYKEPSSDTEKILLQIWSEVLGIDAAKISVKGNFFALGGHSLLVTRIALSIKKKLDVAVPIKLLFQLATIGELARYVDLLLLPAAEYNTTEYDYLDL